jgi:hypothetical protein
MRTPAGKECKYFYGDYHRGRHQEECRLLDAHKLEWSSRLCFNCPVPDILLANACQNMQFTPRLEKALFFLKPEVRISTYCSKCECDVNEPRVGCGQCHPLPDIFVVAPEDPEGEE